MSGENKNTFILDIDDQIQRMYPRVSESIHMYLHAYLKLTFKDIWTNHLSKNTKGCTLVGTKTSNKTTTTTTLNVCIPCLPTTIFVQFCDLLYIILVG